MGIRSEVVVVLRQDADPSVLSHPLQATHLRLEPMFPGATTSEDRRWYLLVSEPGTSDAELDALLQNIRGISGIEAAYRKPPGEPPQDSAP